MTNIKYTNVVSGETATWMQWTHRIILLQLQRELAPDTTDTSSDSSPDHAPMEGEVAEPNGICGGRPAPPRPRFQWPWTLVFLVCFRLVNAIVIRTSFNPDEHWQASEVAHFMAFGYGFLTWEWIPCISLRGIIFPSLFAALFLVLSSVGLDTPWLIAYAPRLLQGVLAGLADYGTLKVAAQWTSGLPRRLLQQRQTAFTTLNRTFLFRELMGTLDRMELLWWVMLVVCGSWFNFFCSPRTYANCLEGVLNVWGIYHWNHLWHVEGTALPSVHVALPLRRESLIAALAISALSVSVRPTAATFWAVVWGAVLLDLVLGVYVAEPTSHSTPPIELEPTHTAADCQNFSSFRSRVEGTPAVGSSQNQKRLDSNQLQATSVKPLEGPHVTPTLQGSKNSIDHTIPAVPQRAFAAKELAIFLAGCLATAVITAGVNLIADSWFYGRWTFPPLNFIRFNLSEIDPGLFFGSHPWHYFLLEGGATVLLSFYPFLLCGAFSRWFNSDCPPSPSKSLPNRIERFTRCMLSVDRIKNGGTLYLIQQLSVAPETVIYIAIVIQITLMSLSSHKEVRFVMPYFAFVLILCARGFHWFYSSYPPTYTHSPEADKATGQSQSKSEDSNGFSPNGGALRIRRSIIVLTFALQVVTAIFFGCFHQQVCTSLYFTSTLTLTGNICGAFHSWGIDLT
eukprot:GHVT01063660.1.p1 GENE.GHVT01063660.1~~GHVT01063660.1.p1  ORF type:complete len:680 (+),score=30.03 GHVT01063660.1:157-2196(+)